MINETKNDYKSKAIKIINKISWRAEHKNVQKNTTQMGLLYASPDKGNQSRKKM